MKTTTKVGFWFIVSQMVLNDSTLLLQYNGSDVCGGWFNPHFSQNNWLHLKKKSLWPNCYLPSISMIKALL